MASAPMYNLYGMFGSSATWRLLLCLRVKRVPFRYCPVPLGRPEDAEGRPLTASPLIPVLEHVPTQRRMFDSVAIMELMEATEEEDVPKLIPRDAEEALRVRCIVQTVAASIQPLQNGGQPCQMIKSVVHAAVEGSQDLVLRSKEEAAAADSEEEKALQQALWQQWARHFIRRGFTTLEQLLPEEPGNFAVGAQITMADVFLLCQCANAVRYFKLDVATEFPRVMAVARHAVASHAEIRESNNFSLEDAPERLRAMNQDDLWAFLNE